MTECLLIWMKMGWGTLKADKVGMFEVNAVALDAQGNEGYAKRDLFVEGKSRQ